MKQRNVRAILALIAICVLACPAPGPWSTLAFAEEDVELALEPPDGGEAEFEEALQEEEGKARDVAEGGEEVVDAEPPAEVKQPSEAEVPQIDDSVYQSRVGTEQMKILRYHKERIGTTKAIETNGEQDPPHRFHAALGVHFGFVNPSVTQGNADFQVTLSDHFTLGALSNFSVTSVLVAAAVNYYSRKPYEGIWVQTGMGYEMFRQGAANFLGDSSIATTTPFVFEMGWRWIEEQHNLTFAFGAGANAYFFIPRPTFYFNLKFQVGLAWNVWPH